MLRSLRGLARRLVSEDELEDGIETAKKLLGFDHMDYLQLMVIGNRVIKQRMRCYRDGVEMVIWCSVDEELLNSSLSCPSCPYRDDCISHVGDKFKRIKVE